MSLSLPTRALIAQQFGIAKTGPTHVSNNQVISDGYDIGAVERALNIDAVQAFVGSNETDMGKLFTMMVDKVEGRIVVAPTPEQAPTEKPKRKYTKSTKKAK